MKYSTIGTIGITVYTNSRNKQNKKLLYFELFDKTKKESNQKESFIIGNSHNV